HLRRAPGRCLVARARQRDVLVEHDVERRRVEGRDQRFVEKRRVRRGLHADRHIPGLYDGADERRGRARDDAHGRVFFDRHTGAGLRDDRVFDVRTDMAQRQSFQIGTGLFILLGFAALTYLATQTTSIANYRQGDSYALKARFTNVGQLKLRAPVKVAGV